MNQLTEKMIKDLASQIWDRASLSPQSGRLFDPTRRARFGPIRSTASNYLTILEVTAMVAESLFGQILFTIRDHQSKNGQPYAILMHPATAYELMADADQRRNWGVTSDLNGYVLFGLDLILDKGIAQGDFIVVSR